MTTKFDIIDDIESWRSRHGIPENAELTRAQKVQLAQDIQASVGKISFKVPEGGNIIPYNGWIGDTPAWQIADAVSNSSGGTLYYISDTEAGELLNNAEFKAAVQQASGSPELAGEMLNGYKVNGVRTPFGYEGVLSLNDFVSREVMLANAHGNVITLTSGSTPDSVWTLTELRTLLDMPQVNSIDGIPKEDLLKAKDWFMKELGYSEAKALDGLREAISYKSSANMSLIDVYRGPQTIVVDPKGEAVVKPGEILGVDVARLTGGSTRVPEGTASVQSLSQMEGRLSQAELNAKYPRLAEISESIKGSNNSVAARTTEIVQYMDRTLVETPGVSTSSTLADAARYTRVRGGALKALGVVGGVMLAVDAVNMIGDASAAYASGDTELGNTIIRDWTLETAGGLVTSQLFMEAVAPIALALGATGGPVGIAAGLLLEVGAGIVGWIVGSELGHGLSDLIGSIFGLFQNAEAMTSCPLVLDLDGDGVETTTIQNGIAFDHDNNSFAEKSAWVGKDDGLLVRDLNGNGRIDSGQELFGNNTLLSGGNKAANGFSALADLDDNHDGKIDAADAVFSQLNIWRDLDGDGITDAGELISLQDAGVASIFTGYSSGSFVDAQGNEHKQTGTYTRTDGTTAAVSDVWFKTDKVNSTSTQLLPVTSEIAALPDLKGFGNVNSLHQAMLRDTTGHLKALVMRFAAEPDINFRKQLSVDIIYAWTGVETINPNQRGGNIDARKLEALEKLFGKKYQEATNGQGGNPIINAAALLSDTFNQLAGTVYSQLTAQTRLKEFYSRLTLAWDATTESVRFDLSGIAIDIMNVMSTDEQAGKAKLNEVAASIHQLELTDYVNIESFRKTFAAKGPEYALIIDIAGRSEVLGSRENDTFTGTNMDEVFWGLEGDDTISGGGGNDFLFGDSGNDTLFGGELNDKLVGGTGDDRLNGGNGDDVLDGGAGNDVMYGGDSSDTSNNRGNGNDTYLFGRGYGQDTIVDYDATAYNADLVKLDESVQPGDVKLRRSGNHLELSVNGTDDKLTIWNYFDASGSYVVETVRFSEGTVWNTDYIRKAVLSVDGTESSESLSGYEGNDSIYGYGCEDTLTGAAGADLLYGGYGDDRLYGNDGGDHLEGEGGGDVLYGGAGDDVLDGGSGNDTLYGGDSSDTSYNRSNGNDTYLFGRGYGQDTIIDYDGTEGNADVIRFAADVKPGDVTVRRSGSSLELLINGTSDKLTVSSFFDASGRYVVESAVFADGTVWDEATLRTAALNIDGSEVSETLSGYETNDTLRGYGGDDRLYGGAGDDVLDGGAGNDTLYGGDNSDSAARFNGNDTYLFGRGSGQDTIVDYDGTEGNADVIRFAADVKPGDVTVRRSGTSLELLINGTSDKLTVSSFFDASGRYIVESAVFADGTVWNEAALRTAALNIEGSEASESLSGYETNDTLRGYGGDDRLYGSAGDDVLDGGSGNDTLYGGDPYDSSYTRANGNDTYMFGRGNGQDTIVDFDGTAGNTDVIQFAADVNPGDITVRRSGSSLELLINGTNDKLTVSNYFETSGKYVVELVQFADGTVWNEAAVRAAARNVTGSEASESMTGYEDNDILLGYGGDDTLSGGAGDDVLDGGDGNDTLYGNAGNDRLQGGQGVDMLQGGAGDDVLDGGAGNDTLYGGDSSDTYYTRANGNDTYLFGRGSGQDTIVDYDGTEGNADVIRFAADVKPGDVTVRRSGSSLELQINGTSDKLTVASFFDASVRYVVESAVFTDGTVWDEAALRTAALNIGGSEASETLSGYETNDTLRGYGGDDRLYGGVGEDVLDGGAGNDTLYGGDPYDTSYTRANGNDTYLFGRGYGQDTILDYDGTAGNADIIQFAADVKPDDITVRRSGTNLELLINGTSDKLTVLNYFEPSGKYIVESVQFADGTAWNEAAVRAAASNVTGSEASESLTGYEDNDILLGYGGDDTLNGGDGDDVLDGGNGNDTLYGNAGNDRLQGGQGADMLQGGAGDDVLDGDAGNDTLYGGDSSDVYYTRANGNDTYLFGRNSGQDTIVDYDGTEGNADRIRFAADVKPGDVTVRRSGTNLELQIKGTSDKLTVSSFFDASGRYVVESAVFADGTVWDESVLRTAALNIDGSEAGESLSGYETNDTLRGYGGDDRLYGGAGDDVLDGGAGNDTLYGGDPYDTSYTRANGNDTYLFGRGYGQDTILDYDGTAGNTDVIQFAADVKPDDITVRRSGSSLELLINGTSDKLTVSNYFEPSGKYVVESVQFADGTVWNEAAVRAAVRNITGGEASESLTGYEDNDILFGFGGDDTLSGGAGDDVLDGGDGNDTLYGNAGNDRLLGGQGADTLQGGLGDDVLDGGGGNDTLYGGDSSDTYYTRINGNDTYLFGRGSGQDTIIDYDGTEGNADVIRFAADVKPSDVTVRRSSTNLELQIKGTSDKLTVASFFDASARYVVESAVFADGTVWDEAALRTAALNIDGSEASETLSGYETNDTLRGYGGDDRLYGSAGDDVLDGGSGNDTLYGGDLYDTSYTRANGNDTYLFGRGYGQDTIVDYDGTEGNTDVIRFAADVKSDDITVRRSGSSLELLINGTNDKLTVSNYFETSGKYVVESVQFADGTVWDSAFIGTHLSTSPANGTGLTLSGTSNNDQLTGGADQDVISGGAGDDVLDGGTGNDMLYGGDRYDTSYSRANGNDTYLFGRAYGQDTIVDYDGTAGNTDVIRFVTDVKPDDITVRRSGTNLELLINGTSDKLTVSNYFEPSGKYIVESIQFADGTVWNEAAVRAAVRNITGGEASESLTGYEDNDILLGYGGDDTLSGGDGDDVLDGGNGNDTLYGNAGNDRLLGDQGVDMLQGGAGDDVLDGGAGNDTLYGGDSSDVYYTRANGNDTYLFNRGSGQDTIIDYDGTEGNADVIRFAADVKPGDVTVRRSGTSLELQIKGTSDKLTVASFFDASARYVVESVEFTDGTIWDEAALRTAALNIDGSEASETLSGYETNDTLRGYGGDDRLYGSAGDDVLDGGSGNDTLYGGDPYDTSYTRANGNDTYLFGRGNGQDTIVDYDGTGRNTDVIQFAADVNPGDITVRRSGSSLELLINGTNDKLTVSNYFETSGKYVVELVQFADGTVWNEAAVRAAARNVTGSEASESLTGYEDNDILLGYGGDDTLSGGDGDDVLDGGDGNDTLYGNAGNDRLLGGQGVDMLQGGAGDDVLDGGAGNDTLYGGDSSDTYYTRANGNDTYLFNRGSGQDTIIDYDGTEGNADVIRFAADVKPGDVTVRRSGTSLELQINGTSDKLTVSSFFDASSRYVVESAVFADGTVWDAAALRTAALNVDGSEVGETLSGYETNDTLRGYGGDDRLYGSAGDDVLDGGAGSDTLYGGDSSDTSYTRANGNDTYLFGRGSGQDTIVDYDGTAGNTDVIRFAADVKPDDITVRRSGTNLELLINGTSDKLTVSNYFETSGKYVVESVQFADGTAWNEAAVRAAARNVTGSEASESLTGYEDNDILVGYGGDDTLSGGDGDDVLDGGNGNDTLYGNAGNDRLQGGQGTDTLQGGAGDDVLDGGAGNDTLYGGDSSDTYYTRANGNDTYLFGRGSGQDTIIDYDGTEGNADVIRFAADVKPSDVTVRRSGSSLDLQINGTSDKLTVASFFDASGRYVVESAVFADGTVWDVAALRTAALNIDGSEASETLSGYETNDMLRGYGGDDRLYGGAGDDVLDGGAGNDTLYGGDPYDTSYTRANGNDTYLFGRGYGQDTIVDYDGTAGNVDIIQFAADVKPGDITVRRSGSSLELLINGTSDKLTVSNYFETSGKYVVESVQFADGTAWNEAAVRAAARNVTGSEASESLTGYEDNDILLGYGGDDTLSSGDGDDVLDGGNGNDTLYGNAGNDRLLGGQGADMLQGGAGDDVLDGGAGNDTLYGGDSSDTYYTRANGNDTYLFGRNSGQDTIVDYDGTAGNADVIRFAADVKPGDVTVRRSGSSLELLINGTSDKLTVASFFDANARYVVESVVFTDGTVWDEAALRTAALNIDGNESGETLSGYETNDTLRGYGGDDRLYGGAGDDMLDGGGGNDTLYGGDPYDTSYTRANGNDTYLFGRGYGQDTIVDYDGTAGNTDVIRFAADVKPDDITVRRSGTNLELLINGTSDKLTVSNYFESSGKYVVESVQFADGTVWNEAAVRAAVRNITGGEASESLTGYEDNDILFGYGGDDTLSGGAGNDELNGGNGNDKLYGNEGNDRLNGDDGSDAMYGGAGDDVLDGGAGNDTLYGGDQYDTSYARSNGNDTYLFGRGSGQDMIIDYEGTEGNEDVIQFAAGVLASDVTLRRNGSNLELLINGTADKLTVLNYFEAGGKYKVESIRFADGTVWNGSHISTAALLIQGGEAGETLNGYEGDDTLFGFGGNDALSGAAGSDSLYGGDGRDTLYGNEGDDRLYGEDGNDVLYGGSGNDVLDGGAGNDTLSGGDQYDTSYTRANGNDTYLFGRGSGQDTIFDYDGTEGNADVISLTGGLLPGDVLLRRSGSNLELLITGTSDKLTVSNYFEASGKYVVETIRFADGTKWDSSFVRQAVLNIIGSESNDTLNGYEGDDSIYGHGGDDILSGAGGNDKLYGDAGVDLIYGNDGSDLLYGGSGGDTLYGGAGDDVLDGGAGNDMLYGGDASDTSYTRANGDDTYLFGRGSGQDTIIDYDGTEGNTDRVQLEASLSPDNITLRRTGNHLEIRINQTSDKLTVSDYFSPGGKYRVEEIWFSDGTVWDFDYVNNAVLSVIGSDESETLNGNDTNDIIYGMGGDDTINAQGGDDTVYGGTGNDILNGMAGNDTLDGGDGNDTLYGGAGNDVLDGGAGDDYLQGNNDSPSYSYSGNDTYVFGKGYGQDRIYDYDTTAGNTDTIQMLVNPSDIEVLQKDGHLSLRIIETGDQLTVQYYFNSSAYQIERVTFADGTVWGKAELEANMFTKGTDAADTLYGMNDYNDSMYGFGGNDTLYGYSGDDTMNGGEGNDTLYGGAGDDVLDGGAGDDYLQGNNDSSSYSYSGNDTYVFGKGYGQDRIYDYDSSSTNTDTIQMLVNPSDIEVLQKDGHLSLRIIETGDQLTVQYYFNSSAYQIERVTFADGTVWGKAELEASVLTKGTEETDTLYGMNDFNDSMYGFGGNDTLYGYSGDDTMNGGEGNDTLYGGAGDDVLDGGAGDDYLQGNYDTSSYSYSGNDTYVFGKGYGQDRIYDYDSSSTNTDTIQMLVNPSDIEVLQKDGHLSLRIIETGDQQTIQYYFNSSAYQIERVTFADGTVWGKAELEASVLTKGTDEGDTLSGISGLNDHMYGYAGNDTLYGYSGNDYMNGGAGNDTLYGGAGNDVLDGGAGDDYLQGNNDSSSYSYSGSDTYVFGRGYGQDRIYDYDTSSTNKDTIQMLVNPSDIEVLQKDGHLSLHITETGDQLTIQYYFNSSAYQIERVTFADGTVWGKAELEANVLTKGTDEGDTLSGISGLNDHMYGYAGNDTLYGYSGNDYMYGDAGNDTLYGGAGNDVLDGGAGDDYLQGNNDSSSYSYSGSDTYVFGRGYGQDRIYDYETKTNTDIVKLLVDSDEVIFSKNASDLVVQINGSEDKATVSNWYTSAAYQTELFMAQDGTRIKNTQIEQLIQAMATYSSSTGTSWSQAMNEQRTDAQQILAQYWTADK